MSKGEILIQYGWLIALLVSVGVISWVVLLLQALFYDIRIGMTGVFGSLLVAFIAVFPKLVPVANLFKLLTVLVCLIFLIWFLLKNAKKASIYVPTMGLIFSSSIGYWVYLNYQGASG